MSYQSFSVPMISIVSQRGLGKEGVRSLLWAAIPCPIRRHAALEFDMVNDALKLPHIVGIQQKLIC